jgi:MoaA/NifB/PqqE/SkfB family radical SAM enzyme
MESFQKTNRSAFSNFLLARYEMYTGEVDVTARPYYLCIDPSDKCQLRCPTCPTGIENEGRRHRDSDNTLFRRERRVLAPDLLHSLMEELGEYLFLVMFYNFGEPLLNPNLADYIREAKTHQIVTELHTNLSLPLSDERIEDLLTSGLDRLLASVDGFTQKTYEIHRVGGDLALVKKNLERLVKTRNRLALNTQISLGFLVFSFNEHEVRDVQKYCGGLGIDFNRREAFVDDPGWLPSYRKKESPWFVPEEALLKKDSKQGWSPLPPVDSSRSPSACGWHHGYSVVTGGGRVAPCCAVAKDAYDLGEVEPGRSSFRDVWNNDRYRKSRAAFAGKDEPDLAGIETICTRCPYPQTIHHLYSVHDAKVIVQFQKTHAGSEPLLEHAFDLFCKARYGATAREFSSGSVPFSLDRLFVGNENIRDTAAFVDFFEENLLAANGKARLASI